jgi:DNA-damage-inducible protein D
MVQTSDVLKTSDVFLARELSSFYIFLKVVEKAIEACNKSGYNPDDHIVEFNDMVEIGSGAKRSAC